MSRCVGTLSLVLWLWAGSLTCAAGPAAGSEFWTVSTRGGAVFRRSPEMTVRQAAGHGWRPSCIEELVATSGQMPTIIYIHGNGVEEFSAVATARQLYRGLQAHAPGPFRFVLWSWPANVTVLGLKQRIQLHARQAEYEGFAVARVVQDMRPGQPISLSGHSLGAITVATALHYLGGGSIGNRALPLAPIEHDLRAAVVAAAVDYDVLLPGYRYDHALYPTHRFVVFKNCGDWVLRHWPRFSFRGAPAMGRLGAATTPDMDAAGPLQHFNAAGMVGRRHSSPTYFRSPEALRILTYAFFAPPEEPSWPAITPGPIQEALPLPAGD